MGRLTVIPTASVGFFDGSTDLSGGGGTLAPQDVVEFYLQPVSLGTTNYTSDFEMDSSDNISVNNVTTSDASGTIYFDVYAGLNLSGGASSGVETAELNFTSTGAIGDGSTPSSLGLAFANGFGDGPAASTGDSTDLNDDGNLDLGSTGNANPAGWADFCQNPGVIGTATGSGSGDCTNVLLGVLAYNYSDAGDGQTAQVTLDSRTGTFAPVFMYELDGVAKADTFHGSKASDLAIGTPVTITYAPAGGLSQASSDENGTVPLTPSSAARGRSQVSSGGLSQVSSDETGTVPFGPVAPAAAVPDVSPPLTIPTGTVSLVASGSGTLILSGDNTYSGGTDIESGTLQLGSQDALSAGCAVTVDSAGTLDLDGWSPQIAALSDGPDGGGAVTNGAATAVALTLAPPSGTPSTFSGTIDDGSNGGAVALVFDGPGTQILTGSNTYSGPTTITGGVLQAGAEYALSPYSDVTVAAGAMLDLNGFDNEVNTLAGSGTVENSAAWTTATLTVGADDTPGLNDMDTTFSGVLQDVGTGQLAIDKTGDDTLTLTNANTYTGETTLDEGTLFVAAGGSIVSPVTVEGGQLDGPDAPTAMGTATTTTLTATASPWIVGQPVTFTATVTLSGGGPASGLVVFMDGNTVLGTATLDDSGNAVFTTAEMAVGDHSISAFYRGSVAEVLLPSGSDAIEHEVNPATPVSLTIDGFSLDDSGELSVQYTIGVGDAVPFTIGIYGSPDGCTPTDLLQTYDAAGADLTVGDHNVTLDADFGELGAADSYLLAVLDTNDDVYVTSRADVLASVSLADYQAVFQNPDDENVYVFTGSGWYNNVAVAQDPTSGSITITVNSNQSPPFTSVSNVYVYSPGSDGTITIAPSVTAWVSVYAGAGGSVRGETENLPEIDIFADTPTTSEAGSSGPGDFTLYRSGDTSGSLTVGYTAGGSARGGTDYQPLIGSVTFAAGDDAVTIPVAPLDAGRVGGAVDAVVTLDPSDDYSIDPDYPSATVTIDDNDLPTVGVTQRSDTFTITMANGATLDKPLLVPYTLGGSATNGVDYLLLSGDVVIPAGSNSATVQVVPIADQAGGNNTVVLTLSSSNDYTVGGSSYATASIYNIQSNPADPTASEFYIGPSGTFAVPSGTTTLYLGFHDSWIWTDNSGSVDVQLAWNNAPPEDCSVPATACVYFEFAPSGTDGPNGEDPVDGYLPIPVTVPTGATSVSITASGDWYYNENVPGSEGGPGGVPGTGQATLQEYMMTNLRSENITPCVCNLGSLVGMWYPDLRPTVTIGDAVAAAGGQEQFTVTLAPPPGAPSGWSYTVDYATQDGTGPDAALAGTDYTAKTGTLDFSAGHTSQTFTVDTDADGNATAGDLNFTVQLSDPSVADDGPATLNIVNGTGTGLIEPPVFNPTVSISSPDGSSNEFTVSYDGTREELDLSATVAASIAAQGDCYVVLPSVAGLEFWTAQTGGEQLTPDADGNLVYDAMPTSGEYSNTLWVCVDPNSPACAEFKTIPLTVELGSTEPSGLAGGVSPAAQGVATTSRAATIGAGQQVANVVVSGFAPFTNPVTGVNRGVNTSEVIADQIAADNANNRLVHIQEVQNVPVVWGQPEKQIQKVLAKTKTPITLWLALGEGTTQFTVETVARNARLNIRDGEGKLPTSLQIIPGGKAILGLGQFPVGTLRQQLGLNVQTSKNAGGYLCEEMFYDLLNERYKPKTLLQNAVFIHVPALPAGTTAANNNAVKTFSSEIVDAILKDLPKKK